MQLHYCARPSANKYNAGNIKISDTKPKRNRGLRSSTSHFSCWDSLARLWIGDGKNFDWNVCMNLKIIFAGSEVSCQKSKPRHLQKTGALVVTLNQMRMSKRRLRKRNTVARKSVSGTERYDEHDVRNFQLIRSFMNKPINLDCYYYFLYL